MTRLAAKLRGRHSKREAGRLDRLSRCSAGAARLQAPRGWLVCIGRVYSSVTSVRTQQPKKRPLKQMIVEGAFGSTPDASSWSTPIAFLEREVSPADVTRLLARRRKKRSVRAARKVPTGTAISKSTDEPPGSYRTWPGPPRTAHAPVQQAPRDQEAWGDTASCTIRVSQTIKTLSGPRRNRRRRAKGNQLDCRVATANAVQE